MLSPRVALVFWKIDLFEEKWSQDASWDDLGPIWVAKRGRLGRPFAAQVGPKRMKKSDAKKGLVLGGQGGGVAAFVVGSLEAGLE